MPRRESLVIEYLENMSRELLGRYQSLVRAYVHGRHGVYALYRRGRLYYVGLATSLRGRLNAHLKDRHAGSWDRFSVYLTVSDRHMKELESLLLRIVKPSGNRQSGKFAKAVNLKRRLARERRLAHQRETDLLFGFFKSRGRIRSGAKRRDNLKPDLANWFTQPTTLRATYKGKQFRARVRRDGKIRFGGKLYFSVSEAARQARGRKGNAWAFWRAKNARGEWVKLRSLAKK